MFTSIFTKSAFLFSISLATLNSAFPVGTRDVYAPPITYPHQGTVWYTGQFHNVTWNTSDPPSQITNPYGRIVLAKNGIEDGGMCSFAA